MNLSAPIFRLKRRARLLARESNIPLHAALDRIARQEGWRSWSHLAAQATRQRPARSLLPQLVPGDLVLLGARPGQGKTLLAGDLAVEAARSGRRSFFFSPPSRLYSKAHPLAKTRSIQPLSTPGIDHQ